MQRWDSVFSRDHPAYTILNVARYVHDDELRGGPWGTTSSCQDRLLRDLIFREFVVPIVLGRMIQDDVVLVSCRSGHHIYVAAIEVATRLLHQRRIPVTVEAVHVNIASMSPALWERLLGLHVNIGANVTMH